jgi:hypothetical protein
VKRTKNYNFIHSARPQAPDPGRIGIAKTVAQFAATHLTGPYSQSRLALPSKTLARGNNVCVSSRCCASEVHGLPNAAGFGDQTMR